jgi:hypothetical protein
MEMQVIGHSQITENIGVVKVVVLDYSEISEISGQNRLRIGGKMVSGRSLSDVDSIRA